MRDNDAVVDPHLVGSATVHGGVSIRGVISTEALANKEILLQVPRKLWMVSDHFPEIENS